MKKKENLRREVDEWNSSLNKALWSVAAETISKRKREVPWLLGGIKNIMMPF